MAENFRNGRHGSPSKEFQSLFFHDDLKHLFAWFRFSSFCGKKNTPTPYSRSPPNEKPRVKQALEKNLCDICNKNSYSVSCFTLGVFAGSMFKIFYDF